MRFFIRILIRHNVQPMETGVPKIPLGAGNCYLIKGDDLVLVESGSLSKADEFLIALKKLHINPKDISLIFLTHGHWDHITGISEIKKVTGAKVAINHHEKEWVEKALKPMPPVLHAWGKILIGILQMVKLFVNFEGAAVDIVLEDKPFSLESFGLNGRIIYTPGHSSGSMTLILDSGEAFAGDTAMNGMPLRSGPGLPIFAEDLDEVKRSWKYILESGAKTIFPYHGEIFSFSIFEAELATL